MKTLATLLMLIASVSPLAAGDYAVGYVSSDGYTYDGAYWTYNGLQYTRTPYQAGGSYYYSNGCRYYQPTYTAYTYSRYYPPAIDLTSDSAEEIIIKGALAQWDRDAVHLKKITNQNYHLALIDKVGLARPNGVYPYSSSYAGAHAQLYAGSYSIGSYGVVPSNTVYGSNAYTVKQTVQTNDPNFDINQAVLLQSQSANNALAVGERVSSLFHGAVDKATAGQNEISRLKIAAQNELDKIEADTVAFKVRMDALRKVQTTVTTTTSGAAAGPVMPKIPDEEQNPIQPLTQPRQAAKSGSLEALNAYVTTSCIGCHAGTQAKGGFDLQQWGAWSQQEKSQWQDKIVARMLLPSTDVKMMPRSQGKDSAPGKRATTREIRLFLEN